MTALDLVQLRYFLRVAELSSFTKAAAALHIAQPAVTRQVRLLEEELGVQLLLRHSRGAELTAAGHRMVSGAQTLFRDLAQVRSEVIATSEAVVGHLRIGFPPSVGSLLIGNVVATFRQRYPQVALSFREGYSQSLRDDLLGDRLDAALLTGEESNPLLSVQALFEEQLWLLEASAGENAPAPAHFSLSDVALRPLVQPDRSNTMRLLLEERARDAGLTLNVVVEAEALQLIKALVSRGVGAHVSPYSAVSQDADLLGCIAGPIDNLTIWRQWVRRVDRPVSAALMHFHAILVEELAQVQKASNGAIRTI
ncbi:LysR family transcriptional regulator [Comamonas sp. Tr-654]|nr:LysR family transcriptional regulator [Comamonas sp. Tr-654]